MQSALGVSEMREWPEAGHFGQHFQVPRGVPAPCQPGVCSVAHDSSHARLHGSVREAAVASGSRTCTLTPYASPTRATGLRKERTVDTFAANDAVCGEKRASSVRRCVGGARRQVRAPTFRSPNRDLDLPSLWARQPRWLTADVVRPAGSGGLVTARAPAGDLTSMADGAASHVAPASRCSRLLE